MGKPTSQNNSFINHFSHPHRLQLTPAPSSPPCYACKLAGGSGRMYSCRPCNFSIHESCSKMKQVITHPSHPSHTLTLLVAPVYDGGYFNCDGCGVIGTGFSYQCSRCDFDIHALCAYKPFSIIHKSHPQHNLKLAFHSPYGANKGFSCDICLKIGKNQWLYRCIPCEFDAHVGCITAASPPPQPHMLQHSTSAPTPHTHHAGHPQHQNSLPMPPNQSSRPRPRPISTPNQPIAQNVAAYGPRRLNNNNLGYNGQVGSIGTNDFIGQGSTDGSGYDGSVVNEEFAGEGDAEVGYDGHVYEGGDDGEANDEGENIDGNELEIVAYGDDNGAACSESEFGGSSDARSQCNDLSDVDLYPLSLDRTQGPARVNQVSRGGRRNNTNPNDPTARSKNMGPNRPRGGLQGSKNPIQSHKELQTTRVQNVRNNAVGVVGSVRTIRPRDPAAFNGPPVFNGPNDGTFNAIDSGGNNNNYNEVNEADMYGIEDNAGYDESYGDDYGGDDGNCDFEAGGDFVDDGYGQAYDETYEENDFESYSDITGGSESMYDGDESYGYIDDSQYSGLNDQPNNQYLPMVGPVGGPVNNQNLYGQTGRPRNMGSYGRGGNINRYGNMNQRANNTQQRTTSRVPQYRPNGGIYRANAEPNGPNGPNGLGNTVMNTMVQSLCQGFAMNMLVGVGGDVSGGGDGSGSSVLGGLFGGESESQF